MFLFRSHNTTSITPSKTQYHNTHHTKHKSISQIELQWKSLWKSLWEYNLQSQQKHDFISITFSYANVSSLLFQKDISNTCSSQHHYIIRLQHTPITKKDVQTRKHYDKQQNETVIWLLNGNTPDITCEKLSTNHYCIHFQEQWKYASFQAFDNNQISYEYVLLDVQNKIFKLPVHQVCNQMILVKAWKPLDDVIHTLQSRPQTIWDLWTDDNEVKPTIRIQQKGSGNGKTFGIWKSIAENQDKDLFLIVTKQHSAKTVIHKELNDQMDRYEWHIVDNIELLSPDEMKNKKIIIHYQHKHSLRVCKVIIATIDSFIWNLTEFKDTLSETNKHRSVDYFKSLRRSIPCHGLSKVNPHNGRMRYAGYDLFLNKKVELWIDEAQDLDMDYVQSIVRVVIETKIDVVVVGDKLQSLEHNKNFLTCSINDLAHHHHHMNIMMDTPINENRRICVEHMVERINQFIQFKKCGVPEITLAPETTQTKRFVNSHPFVNAIETIDMPRIYANDQTDKNQDTITQFVETLITKVHDEVSKHSYIPNDFLFVFPIMKCNMLACELETKLNEYWIDKYKPSSYTQYAVLHRHEEGQVIDMNLSKDATRIVSIRTSKGDGRKVVFVLGCTEKSLQLVSREEEKGILYESYLHVAMTRAKEKIYFGLEKNNDDIHQRFGAIGLVEYKPIIRAFVSTHKLMQYVDSSKWIDLLKHHGVPDPVQTKHSFLHQAQHSQTLPQMDWVYHCIRRSVYLQHAIFNILQHAKNNSQWKTSQIRIILEKLSELPISRPLPPKKYYETLHHCADFYGELPFFPLCNMSHKIKSKNPYRTYCHQLQDIIQNNQSNYLRDPLSILHQTPLEAVIQWYTIDLFRHHTYCEISPMMIYNILHHYHHHEHNDDTPMKQFLQETEKIKHMTNQVMQTIFSVETNVQWNIGHMIKLYGCTHDMNVQLRNIPIIGNSEDCVYHFVFKTDCNALNYWDTLLSIALERFIIYNPLQKGKDIQKFKCKPIKTFLFILKQNQYNVFDWDWDNRTHYSYSLKCIIRDAIVNYFQSYHTSLYHYCTYISNTSQKWKKTHCSPYEYIASEYNDAIYPKYIYSFFNTIHNKYKNGEQDHVKHIVNHKHLFCDALNKTLEDMCNRFFGLEST